MSATADRRAADRTTVLTSTDDPIHTEPQS